ncbi:phytanoyl-CoA dioxygenase [Aureococcus anophagefferens]|nr:phytanoyl-CoA dioxygenase [Aureococcus anophagefferens]
MYDKHDGSWVRTGVGTYAQTAGAAPPKIDVWSGVAMVAADTDFGGLGCRPAEAARQRVAVLFVGEVRLRDADSFRALQDATAGCDGFVATYARHFPTARELFGRPDRVVGVDGAVAACEICGQKGGGRLISWVQLQAARAGAATLRRFGEDADGPRFPSSASLVPAVGRVHAEIFVEVAYAAPPVFYAAFGNCVDRLIKPWFARGDGFGFSRRNSTRPVYVPLNWTNALESDLTALRWRWLHVPERLGGAIATPRDLKRVIFDHLPELEGARTGEPAVLADAMEACAVNEFASALCGQFGLFSSETFMAYAILQAAPACLIAGRQNLSPGNLYSLAEDRHAFTWARTTTACLRPTAARGAAAADACQVRELRLRRNLRRCHAGVRDHRRDGRRGECRTRRPGPRARDPGRRRGRRGRRGLRRQRREAQLAANIEGERRACFAAAAKRAADVAARVAARLADRGTSARRRALMSARRLAALGPEDVSLKPFPHVVVDGFLPDGAFAALLDQFGALEAAVDVAVGDDRLNHVAGDYKTAPVGRDVLETRAFTYGGATVEAQNATLALVDALTRRARPGEARGVLDVHLARLFAPHVPPGALDSLAPGAARAWPYKVLSLGAGAGRKRAEAPHLDGPAAFVPAVRAIRGQPHGRRPRALRTLYRTGPSTRRPPTSPSAA